MAVLCWLMHDVAVCLDAFSSSLPVRSQWNGLGWVQQFLACCYYASLLQCLYRGVPCSRTLYMHCNSNVDKQQVTSSCIHPVTQSGRILNDIQPLYKLCAAKYTLSVKGLTTLTYAYAMIYTDVLMPAPMERDI